MPSAVLDPPALLASSPHRRYSTLKERKAIGLTANDLLFVNHYLAHDRNGTQTYLAVHPKASVKSARTEGSRILAKPCVQQEIARRLRYDVGITKEWGQSRLLNYIQMAEAKGDYVAGASICMDAMKLAGFLVEKREIKTLTEEQKTALRSLVDRALRPSATSSAPTTSVDSSAPSAPSVNHE